MTAFRKLGLLATAALGFAITPAQAAVQVTAFSYSPNALFGGLNVGASSFGGDAGRFLTTIQTLPSGPSVDRYTFCLDALTGLFTFSPYSVVALSDLVPNATKQAQIAGLLSHADAEIAGSSNQALTAAAFALSIWEIFYEAGTSGYSLTNGNGNFSVFGDLNAAGDEADILLANNWTASGTLVRGLSSNTGTSQNQVYYDPNAVPEPATWLTMIMGMGLIGAAMRRNKRQTTSATITFA
jgi:hypothetical protein